MSQDDLTIIWEYLSLEVVCVKLKGQIKWSIISSEKQRQPIPYTPYPYIPPLYELDNLLNDYGAKGWELAGVATIPTRGYSGWYPQVQLQLFFKRPKQEEE